ncbi:MAG TPA: GNAT family N-acetyltransferase [Stellaceae bacterium]|nr:GNAT family N-acetyltransferase [Stellaceae bacterium]
MSRHVTPLPAGAAAPLAAMHGASFPEEPWDAAAFERVLALSGIFGYLTWEGDDPTGFLVARDLGGEIEILSIGVLPEWRRRGTGRTLLDAVIAETRRRRAGSIVLEVASANQAARSLYAACGFVQVGRRPRYYRHPDGVRDALILRRSATDKPPAR